MVTRTPQFPVTVPTGVLGTCWTTLLNRILTEQHGKCYAVIVNQCGEQGTDNDLLVDTDEEVFEMNNACICCTGRGDLIRIPGEPMKRPDKFDAILLETTGPVDLAPVAQTVFVDPDVAAKIRRNAVVPLVDAHHIERQFDASHEAAGQPAFADPGRAEQDRLCRCRAGFPGRGASAR
ncbi:GTP-binding protein [Mesobaculum littorinae]|uniref:GTP-binding protein n=1 Tax=Mesobaculum littorinae TaxID=2486419 RepID=UPI001F4615BB|nr:GTP-binding protein [Mesobaculum littorinae]